MTLKERIRQAIVAEYPGNLTNQQLAVRLDANEPSVRRATKELYRAMDINEAGGGYSGQPVLYVASGPAPAPSC